MNRTHPEATIFGSSAPQQEDFEYKTAYELAAFLTEQGFLVKTGGYYGTMEAASKGSMDSGRKSIGVPLASFDPKKPNQFCEPEKVDDIFQRLRRLIHDSVLIVILPGRQGTLTEFFLTWEMLESSQLKSPPKVCCVGEQWQPFLDEVKSRWKIKEQDFKLLEVFTDLNSFRAAFQSILEEIPPQNE